MLDCLESLVRGIKTVILSEAEDLLWPLFLRTCVAAECAFSFEVVEKRVLRFAQDDCVGQRTSETGRERFQST
jgi:hypothetical protein